MAMLDRGMRYFAVLGCALLLPRAVFGQRETWEDLAFAHGVAQDVTSGVSASKFRTGSARFDGEWAFGTFLMATLGLGQTALAHPQERERLLPAMRRSTAQLTQKQTNAFGTEAWGNVGLDTLEDGLGHGYLGYANLALSMLRLLEPDTAQAALNDRLTEALARRLAAAPHGIFETYPGEAYPPDMSMVAGSIALHDCALGLPERAFMPAWRRAFARYIDAESGLLYQAADAQSGQALGPPRGSGTAIAAYSLSFADRALSDQLYQGLRRQAISVLGFGMMREYPSGRDGTGDIDSGPVLFGVGVSATGFALASARLHHDDALFTQLYRTIELMGVPLGDARGRHFMSGGPLGNAIMLAMATATPDWSRHCRKNTP
jgi:hypothetical protein